MNKHIKDISDRKQPDTIENEKKPFNKKQYRLKKYSNKYKSMFRNCASNKVIYVQVRFNIFANII